MKYLNLNQGNDTQAENTLSRKFARITNSTVFPSSLLFSRIMLGFSLPLFLPLNAELLTIYNLYFI